MLFWGAGSMGMLRGHVLSASPLTLADHGTTQYAIVIARDNKHAGDTRRNGSVSSCCPMRIASLRAHTC